MTTNTEKDTDKAEFFYTSVGMQTDSTTMEISIEIFENRATI